MTKETKFIPGPWKYRKGRGCEWRNLITACRGREVILGFDGSDRVAEAHLIAAAPELYESLSELAGILNGDGRTYVQEALERAQAYLAKARGEKP